MGKNLNFHAIHLKSGILDVSNLKCMFLMFYQTAFYLSYKNLRSNPMTFKFYPPIWMFYGSSMDYCSVAIQPHNKFPCVISAKSMTE